MADVFISYAHTTARQAHAAAAALRAAGYSVWLDDDLAVHRAFGQAIEEQLTAAKAALVIWSADAAKSEWVLSEANRAREDHKLVQLVIDKTRLPMPFDQVQCADLSGWTGEGEHPNWRRVIASVETLVGSPAVGSPAPSAPPAASELRSDLQTLLLCDIDGAGLLSLNHRAAMQEAVAVYNQIVRGAVESRGGRVFRAEGETLYAAFRTPSDAVGAAVAALRSLAGRTWPGFGQLKGRMALHVGAAEYRGEEIFGPALIRCAKLLALGHGGQALASATVADLMSGGAADSAALRFLGAHPLDDPLQPIGVYQVTAEGLAPDFPPLSQAEAHPNNLPKRLGALIGREAELAALGSLLQKADLVTVTGTGGVGKTRIAIEVGHAVLGDYADGVWLAELAPVSDPEQVPGVVARAMMIELPAGQDPLTALVNRLEPMRCLIVLDNCEHVIDTVAALAEAVLDASSGVKMLTSSQELLGVEGEQVFRLRSLGEPDAAALFAERAHAVDANFSTAGRNVETIRTICQRLDGIPLAIEMAAARAPSLGCEGLLQRLDDRFRVLTGGRRTALPRQRTLQATLDWSHSLLSERDAAVYRRVGVFTGGFTLEAASDLCADATFDAFDVVDGLSSLVAKSLVAADTEDNRTRYRLLETTRAYALEKLAAVGETAQMQRRHAQYFVGLCEKAGLDYYALVTDDEFAARYFPDLDNTLRALDWAFGPDGDLAIGVELAGRSWVIAVFRALPFEHLAWLERAYTHLNDVEISQLARAILLDSRAACLMLTYPGRAVAAGDEAIAAAEAVGEPAIIGNAHLSKSQALLMTGRIDEAEASTKALLRLASGMPPSRLTAWATVPEAIRLQLSGDVVAAREGYERALALTLAIGADGLANQVLISGLGMMFRRDDPIAAIDRFRDTLARIRPSHMLSSTSTMFAATSLAMLLMQRDAPGDFQEVQALCNTVAKSVGRSLTNYNLAPFAAAAAKAGRAQDGARLVGFLNARLSAQGITVPAFVDDNAWASRFVQATLPPAEFEAMKAEGARMSVEDAFRLATRENS
ncbi:MAG TPA: TIR domain-containing protein [Caulobacteraceae bacterium]|jgi:predicted ATPase